MEITSHGAGEVLIRNQSTRFQGEIRDVDVAHEELKANWFIGEKKVCRNKLVDEEGVTSCKAKVRGEGDSTLELVVRAPAMAGVPERSFSTSIPVEILPAWQIPVCSITSHEDGDAHPVSQVLTFEGDVRYAGGPVDEGSVSWSSDVAGLLGTSEIGSSGHARLDVSDLSVGNHAIQMQYAPEEAVGCEAMVELVVATGPEVSWITPASGASIDQGDMLELTASISLDGGVLGLGYELKSDLDGPLVEGILDDTGELLLSVDLLGPGAHELTLTVWSNIPVPGWAVLDVAVDGWPTDPRFELSPDPATQGDSLYVNMVEESVDPEGASVVYAYAWLQNGLAVAEHDGAVEIDGSLVHAGDTWTARIQASDGRLAGPWVEESRGISGYAGWAQQEVSILEAQVSFQGDYPEDRAGSSLASGCDVDGDGRDDLFVGAPYGNSGGSNSGQAYLVLGSELVPDTQGNLGDFSGIVEGEAAGDNLGYAVACLGDVDGDGLDDLIASAPGNDYSGSSMGRSYVYLGASLPAGNTQMSAVGADWLIHGEERSDQAGSSLAAAGDVDGDGLADILIGSWTHNSNGTFSGRTYVVLASELGSSATMGLEGVATVLDGVVERGRSGFSVAGLGDTDGDGLGDVIVGAYSEHVNGEYSGSSYVVSGQGILASSTIDLDEADHVFWGETGGDYSGYRVQGVGDVDGDGADDIAIGAIGSSRNGTHAGATYVVFASTLGGWTDGSLSGADLILVGESAGDESGRAISTSGDIDGDGRADLLVGAPYNSEGAAASGKVYLWLASSLGSGQVLEQFGADHIFTGAWASDNSGMAVDMSGDVNGDGVADLAVGVPGYGLNADGRGQLVVLFGPNLLEAP